MSDASAWPELKALLSAVSQLDPAPQQAVLKAVADLIEAGLPDLHLRASVPPPKGTVEPLRDVVNTLRDSVVRLDGVVAGEREVSNDERNQGQDTRS